MSVEKDIYDIEGAIEEAFATVLTSHSLIVVTPVSSPDFQQERPRVELLAMVQGGAGRLLPEAIAPQRAAPGHLREVAYKVQLKVEAITAIDIAEHRTYLATIRNRFAKIAGEITLTLHYLQSCRDAGSTPAYKGEDGYYRSTLLYDLDVSIQSNAFDNL